MCLHVCLTATEGRASDHKREPENKRAPVEVVPVDVVPVEVVPVLVVPVDVVPVLVVPVDVVPAAPEVAPGC